MEKLKSFFRFTSRERLAILFLCLLMVLFWTLPLFFPEKPVKISMPLPNGAKTNSYTNSNIVPVSNDPSSAPTTTNNDHYSTKAPARVPHYFPFNPNTISPQQWEKLGLSDRTILTIQHYLEKGGRFKKPEDLRKIWGLKPAEANGLIPYVQIQSSFTKDRTNFKPWQSNEASTQQLDSLNKQPLLGIQSNQSNQSNSFNKPNASLTAQSNDKELNQTPYPKKTWKLQPIDINLADKEQWMAFPGIGDILAERIVKFRDKIGGFKSIEQVGKTYGIKDSLFQLMKPFLIFESATQEKD